jgi:hypothetical protein
MVSRRLSWRLHGIPNGLFAEEIQPVVAMGFGGGWMRRKFPALIPVAGNHFGQGDGGGRLFRLGLEDEPIRQALFGFVKVRRAETDTLGPVAFPPAAIPGGAACPLPKPEDPELEATFFMSFHGLVPRMIKSAT